LIQHSVVMDSGGKVATVTSRNCAR
jgi:hypothetical protein